MKYANLLRRLLVIGAGTVSLGLLSPSVEARSVGAVIGLAGSVDMPCLAISLGTMANTCTRVISFDWPLVIDNAGAKTATVSGFGASSANNVGCKLQGANKQSTVVTYSNGGQYLFLPTFGQSADIVLTGVTVPPEGQLLVNCQISPGGRIDVVNWNP